MSPFLSAEKSWSGPTDGRRPQSKVVQVNLDSCFDGPSSRESVALFAGSQTSPYGFRTWVSLFGEGRREKVSIKHLFPRFAEWPWLISARICRHIKWRSLDVAG